MLKIFMSTYFVLFVYLRLYTSCILGVFVYLRYVIEFAKSSINSLKMQFNVCNLKNCDIAYLFPLFTVSIIS